MPVGPSGPIGDGSHPSEQREQEPARDWDDEIERRREREEDW